MGRSCSTGGVRADPAHVKGLIPHFLKHELEKFRQSLWGHDRLGHLHQSKVISPSLNIARVFSGDQRLPGKSQNGPASGIAENQRQQTRRACRPQGLLDWVSLGHMAQLMR